MNEKLISNLLNKFAEQTIIIEFVLIGFLLLVSFLLKKLLTKIMLKALAATNKNSAQKYDSRDESLVKSINWPVSILLVIGASMVCVQLINGPEWIFSFIKSTFRVALIFSVVWVICHLIDLIEPLLKRYSERSGITVDHALISFFSKLLKIIVIVIGTTIAVQNFVGDITGLIAGLGVGGVAFAYAGKDAASNLFGSFMIMVDKPFGVGDWISTDKLEGIVEQIGFRSTRIRTFEQAIMIVPNTVINNDIIINWSKAEKRRITINVVLDHNTAVENIDYFMQAVKEMLCQHVDVCDEEIQIYFEKLSEVGIYIIIRFFTRHTAGDKIIEIKNCTNLEVLKILKGFNMKFSRIIR